MAFQNRSKGNTMGVRLTGLFLTKRKGLYVGTLDDAKIDELIALIKKAKNAGKEITAFLWKSTFATGPAFSINMDIARDRAESATPADWGEESGFGYRDSGFGKKTIYCFISALQKILPRMKAGWWQI